MKILFASDSFKGTLSSKKTIELLSEAAKEVFPGCEYDGTPVADGGEGTIDAVVTACGGSYIKLPIHGPYGDPVDSYYGQIDEKKAIIEMALACGLTMVDANRLDPRYASSTAVGEMINDAVEKGFADISIALGGSATNDGGMGCLRTLGYRFLDAQGHELTGEGKDLINVCEIDDSNVSPKLKEVSFTIMCDVDNPLCGQDGATYTFGKQKGGTPEILDELEKGMQNYRDVIIKKFGINPDTIKGAGAAGGMGAALNIFLKSEMKSGIDTVLDLLDFDRKLQDVDLVISGEGRADWQSAHGKVMCGIGQRCRKYNVPVVAIVGCLGDGYEALYDCGVETMLTTVDRLETWDEITRNAERNYRGAAIRLMRCLKTGMLLKK